MKQLCFYPTYDEILVIERAARQAQAVEMIRLVTLAASRLKALMRRFASALSRALGPVPAPAVRSNLRGANARATLASIIEEMHASLPVQFSARHAEELAAAARAARLIDFIFASWDFSMLALARIFRFVACGLRVGAQSLNVVARHITPMHQASSAKNG